MVLANLGSLWNTEMLAAVLKAVRWCTASSSSWVQLTSTSMHWLRKVAAGICYIHRGPSVDLLVRISSKFSSGFEVPDASEPQDPSRTQAANTTRLSTTTHPIRKVLSAIIVNSYARCPLHGLVI